jgi:hypothetical protein
MCSYGVFVLVEFCMQLRSNIWLHYKRLKIFSVHFWSNGNYQSKDPFHLENHFLFNQKHLFVGLILSNYHLIDN